MISSLEKKNGSKYFVGSKNKSNEDVTPFFVWHPRMSEYLKNFDDANNFFGWEG